jgi:hypothetical protein
MTILAKLILSILPLIYTNLTIKICQFAFLMKLTLKNDDMFSMIFELQMLRK